MAYTLTNLVADMRLAAATIGYSGVDYGQQSDPNNGNETYPLIQFIPPPSTIINRTPEEDYNCTLFFLRQYHQGDSGTPLEAMHTTLAADIKSFIALMTGTYNLTVVTNPSLDRFDDYLNDGTVGMSINVILRAYNCPIWQ